MDIVEYRPGDAYTRIARINKTEKWKKRSIVNKSAL